MIIASFGHRPDEFGGCYEPSTWNPAIAVYKDWLAKKLKSYGFPTALVHGCALGGDNWSAIAALQLKKEGALIEVWSFAPFEGFDSKWSQEQRDMLARILSKSERVETISKRPAEFLSWKEHEQRAWVTKALHARNRAVIVDSESDMPLAAWNGKYGAQGGGTAKSIRIADERPEYRAKLVNLYFEIRKAYGLPLVQPPLPGLETTA